MQSKPGPTREHLRCRHSGGQHEHATKLQSPLRGILRTPIRALGPGPSPGLEQLRSPVCRTPRKSVTWSPHQRGGTLVRDAAFKVPEWPQTPQRLKPGSGPGSPAESTRRNISRSLEQQTPEEPTSRPSAGPPEPEDGADGSPARSLAGRRSSHQGVGTRAPSAENLNWSGSRPSEVQSELSQTPDGGSGCSRLSSTSTDDSLDIVEAAVTRAQFTGGLRMNISFSRRSSQSQNLPAAPEPSGGTPARSYGLRQTPDRRQREAAARLGYGNQPRCSTPRGSAGPGPRKEPGPQNPLSYQVELERQTSGVPKLNLKRTDSTGAAEPGAPGPAAAFRGSRQREPGRGSPPSCAHTPAKSTPGKGLQTFICQSCTPTRRPGGTAPPVGAAEGVPLTPSPQGLGRTPPDHLNSWPRRKRARPAAAGAKERGPAESVEEAELGVRRLQDGEELHPAASTRAPLEDFYWMERLAQQAGSAAPPPGEPASRDPRAAVSPPSLRGRRPVSASGILALTRSPLLFRGRSAAAEAAPAPGEGSGRRRAEEEGVDGSPGGRTSRRCSRTFSRKHLLT